MCQKLTAIKLPQSLGDFQPKPCIVIDVALFVCAAQVARRHAFKLRLHLRGEVYFMAFRVWSPAPGVKFPALPENALPARFPPNTAQRKSISRLNGPWRVG